MSNCIKISNSLHIPVRKLKNPEEIVENWRTNKKDSWEECLRTDGGTISLYNNKLVIEFGFTTYREASYCLNKFLEERLLDGETIDIYLNYSDEFDGYETPTITCIPKVDNKFRFNSYLEKYDPEREAQLRKEIEERMKDVKITVVNHTRNQ